MTWSIKFSISVMLLGCLLAVQSEARQQKMYSWTDENGVVHFSDQEPVGQQVQEQLIPGDEPSTSSSPYSTPDANGSSVAEQKRQEIAKKNEENRASQAKMESQCSAWKAEVAQLEPNRRVLYTNDQGETERMDDVVRTNRVAELKSQIAQNCR